MGALGGETADGWRRVQQARKLQGIGFGVGEAAFDAGRKMPEGCRVDEGGFFRDIEFRADRRKQGADILDNEAVLVVVLFRSR